MENLLAAIGNHLFLIFGILALIGACAMVAARNAVYSVIGFLFCMISVAACYLCLEAEFLALAQIMVYAGGIVVLFLFVVMLVEMGKPAKPRKSRTPSFWPLLLISVLPLLFGSVFTALVFKADSAHALTLRPELAQHLDVATHNAQAVSRGLYADYLLPFEILSVILLLALVGAVTLAKTKRV